MNKPEKVDDLALKTNKLRGAKNGVCGRFERKAE